MIMNRHLILKYSDERMIPELSNEGCFWEHVFRYQFASQFVKDKRVLDIASGEGYGSLAMNVAGASFVIGVDISNEACEHARKKYEITGVQATAEQIPLKDHSVDVVVSFETVEHVPNPEAFVRECARVLSRPGTMVMSTPNTEIYDPHGQSNPYHCSEMTESEFTMLLQRHFDSIELYGQTPQGAPLFSLRSLYSQNPRWNQLPGFANLRKLCSAPMRHSFTERVRKEPEKAILAEFGVFHKMFNPYLVRKRDNSNSDASMMLVAVCSLL
jgi:2-polyprenyl-3-methyl-5-hydroxy-6-metoxy-1,4-benzoquinol methylase